MAEDVRTDFARAAALHRQGQLDEAIDIYRRLLKRRPGLFEVERLLVFAQLQAGRVKQAHAVARKARQAHRSNPHAHVLFGATLQAELKFADALAAFDQASALDPGLTEAHYLAGNMLASLERHAEAAERFGRVIALDPRAVEAVANRAAAFVRLDRKAEALEDLARLCALQPWDPAHQLARGALLIDLDRPGEALAAAEAVIASRKGLADAFFLKGRALLASGDAEAAFTAFRAAIAAAPDRPAFHAALARAERALAAPSIPDSAPAADHAAAAAAADGTAAQPMGDAPAGPFSPQGAMLQPPAAPDAAVESAVPEHDAREAAPPEPWSTPHLAAPDLAAPDLAAPDMAAPDLAGPTMAPPTMVAAPVEQDAGGSTAWAAPVPPAAEPSPPAAMPDPAVGADQPEPAPTAPEVAAPEVAAPDTESRDPAADGFATAGLEVPAAVSDTAMADAPFSPAEPEPVEPAAWADQPEPAPAPPEVTAPEVTAPEVTAPEVAAPDLASRDPAGAQDLAESDLAAPDRAAAREPDALAALESAASVVSPDPVEGEPAGHETGMPDFPAVAQEPEAAEPMPDAAPLAPLPAAAAEPDTSGPGTSEPDSWEPAPVISVGQPVSDAPHPAFAEGVGAETPHSEAAAPVCDDGEAASLVPSAAGWAQAVADLADRRWHAGWAGLHTHAAPPDPLPLPRWDGVSGATTLVVAGPAGQDASELILFGRLLRLLADRGLPARLLTGADAVALLSRIDARVPVAADLAGLELNDRGLRWVPLASLPALIAPDPAFWPRAPFLTADPARIARWRHVRSGGFTVGIAWGGDADLLGACAGLAAMEGVDLVALDAGPQAEAQLAAVPFGVRVARIGGSWGEGDRLSDMAAVLQHLDLVVTGDGPMAHLAGARARAAVVALSDDAHWCWGRDGGSSPFYPALELVRASGERRAQALNAAVAGRLGAPA